MSEELLFGHMCGVLFLFDQTLGIACEAAHECFVVGNGSDALSSVFIVFSCVAVIV